MTEKPRPIAVNPELSRGEFCRFPLVLPVLFFPQKLPLPALPCLQLLQISKQYGIQGRKPIGPQYLDGSEMMEVQNDWICSFRHRKYLPKICYSCYFASNFSLRENLHKLSTLSGRPPSTKHHFCSHKLLWRFLMICIRNPPLRFVSDHDHRQ